MKALKRLLTMLSMLIGSCTDIPEGISPVQNFELQRYLGQWYEIARLDHAFERGLTHVNAQYGMRDDGGVEVINRGWNTADRQWNEAIGKAYFVRSPDEGYLKVSFFGPFYGAYIIFELDSSYRYAFVAGPNRDYVWLLSRTATVPEALIQKFRRSITELGFDGSQLILVDQASTGGVKP